MPHASHRDTGAPRATMSMAHAGACLGVLRVGLLLIAPGATRAQDAAAEQAGPCRPAMPACWYIVFGTGDAPSRAMYVANGKTRTLPGGEISIEGIELFESPDKYNYVASTFDFDCKARKLRIPRAYAQQVGGRIEHAPPRDQSWTPVQERSWVGQVFKLACTPGAKTDPKKYDILWLSDLARAADVLPLARRILWEREFAPDKRGRRR